MYTKKKLFDIKKIESLLFGISIFKVKFIKHILLRLVINLSSYL